MRSCYAETGKLSPIFSVLIFFKIYLFWLPGLLVYARVFTLASDNGGNSLAAVCGLVVVAFLVVEHRRQYLQRLGSGVAAPSL